MTDALHNVPGSGREPWRRRHRAPLLIGALAALLNLYGLMWGLPNLWDVAADSVVPSGELASRTRDFDRVTAHRYPPLHFDLLSVAFLPADMLARLHPFAGNAKLRSTLYILSARFISAAMGVGIVLGVYSLTQRLFSPAAAVFASLAVAFCPLLQYYSKNANLDVPYTFWLVAALLALERFLAAHRRRPLIWAGLAAAAAVCTKDQAYGCVVLLVVPAMAALRRQRGSWRLALGDKHLWAAAGLSAAAFVLIHRIPLNPGGFARHVASIVGPASEGWRETTRDAAGQLRLLAECLLHLAAAVTPAGVVLIAAGAATALRERRGRWLLWSPLGYWLTFLAVVGYAYGRYLLPVVAALAPFLGLAMERLWRWRPRRVAAGACACAAVLAWMATVCAMVLHDMDFDARLAAQAWIEEHVPDTWKVGYFGEMLNMPRLNRPRLVAERVIAVGDRIVPAETWEDWQKAGARPSDDDVRRRAFDADVLIGSVERFGETGASPWNPGAWLLRRLGSWGRLQAGPPAQGPPAREHPGFRRAAVFRPTFGRFTPDVSPSFGRVIVVYERDPARRTGEGR